MVIRMPPPQYLTWSQPPISTPPTQCVSPCISGGVNNTGVTLYLEYIRIQPVVNLFRVNKHVHKYRSPPLHKADFQGLLSHISRAFQTTNISCMSLDEATAFWQRSLLAGLDAECPEVQARSSNKPRPPPWMNPELQRLQRQRK